MSYSSTRSTLGAALALMVVAGSAFGDESMTNPGIKPADGTMISGSSAGVVLDGATKARLMSAFGWKGRDSGVLDGVITPREVFTEVIGLKERTNRLTVKVKTKAQMVNQIAIDQAVLIEAQRASGNVVRGVDAMRTENTAEFGVVAERRMVEARNRIAPSLIEAFDDVDMHTVELPQGVSAEVMAEILMRTGDYEFVSIDWLCYPTDTSPNDPLFGNQWYHRANRMDSVGAWDHTTGGGEILAVCDSGVDIDHPDLVGALVSGFNAVTNLAQVDGGFVDDNLNGHGTNVAGCSAAPGNNGIGIAGVGWNFGIMPVKVSNIASGNAFLSDILQGARWGSTNGAYASNCSFGGAEDNATRITGNSIRSQGHLLVFSSGNDGVGNQQNDWENVTIVGASNSGDNYATFSNWGVGVDCIAPGVGVRTTNRVGGYGNATGTSFASPIVAGALMLVHSANPAKTADEVEDILLNACDDKQAPGEDIQTGNGRINVGRAVEDAIFGPSIVNLPYLDQFGDGTLNQWRDASGDVEVNGDGVNEPSGDESMDLSGSAQINTIQVRANGFGSQTGVISFYSQHRGSEAGENLLVEYMDIIGNWQTFTTVESDGVDEDAFNFHRYEVPFLGIHDQLRLRFTTSGDEANDHWFVDDVSMKFFEGNTVPWFDDFENGISANINWETSSAIASLAGENEPSGTQSANLDETDSMTSHVINLSGETPVVYVQMYSQHRGVEAGESLTLEFKDVLGNWNTLATIVSDGNDQSEFALTQVELPVLGFGAALQIRVSAQGDEADDDWFIDNVAVTKDFIEEVEECRADITGDGSLNFFDVSEFLNLFGAQDPQSDFNDDGNYNFFDVSEFLNQYGQGCP